VIAEATPEADRSAPAAVRQWISQWPQPFASLESAVAFFGDNNWGKTWAAGLERASDGYRGAFDPLTIERAITEASARDYWDEWRSITRPTLIVRGETGAPQAIVARMQRSLKTAQAVTIPGAGHDVHLAQPTLWIRAIQRFI
jgi:pimeloyl-ACP methyl ester carboxylesterase